MSPLEAALDKLLIADVWRLLGLPGEPPERDKSVRSPFRDDTHPSFSIFASGRRWKDHGTGEQGNAADFLAKARNLSNAEACRELIRLAGTNINANGNVAIGGHRASAAPPRAERKRVIAGLPRALPWDRDIAQRVADSRGLHITAVEFAFLWLKTLAFVRCVQHRVLGAPRPLAPMHRGSANRQGRLPRKRQSPRAQGALLSAATRTRAGLSASCRRDSRRNGSRAMSTRSFSSRAGRTISRRAR